LKKDSKSHYFELFFSVFLKKCTESLNVCRPEASQKKDIFNSGWISKKDKLYAYLI
jgi:hypothetical protein